MKVKLRLDKASIQDFFIQNVEKIVFGVAVLVFLFLVYSAIIGVPRFDKKPEDLTAEVQKGQRAIEQTPPETGLTVPDYEAQAKKSRIKIKEEPYAIAAVLNPPIFSTPKARGEPALYAAHDLRGSAAVGAVQMAPEAEEEPQPDRPMASTGSTTQGQRWVVVTGLVPIEKQIEAFNDLKVAGAPNSYDAQRDAPFYYGYSVERLEVESPSSADAANPDWTKAKTILSVRAIKSAMKQWGQVAGNDIVAPEFTTAHPALVFPLPPTVTPWNDESAAHSPEIPPLQTETRALGPGGAMRPGDAIRPGGGVGPMGGPMGPQFGTEGTEDNPYGESTEKSAAPDRDKPVVPKPTPDAGAAAKSPYVLLRFFDLNVEPGKHYIYRVQLGLRNPNWKLNVAWLENPKLANDQVLRTKWSDPTPVISVPRDTRILAVSVKPGSDRSDPSGKIAVIKWSRRKGSEAYSDFTIVRGQLLNFPDETFTPASGVPQPMFGGGGPGPGANFGIPGPGGPGPGGARPLPMQMPRIFAGPTSSYKVNYFTNATALDFRGGEVLRGRRSNSLKLAAVGDILLLDSDGNLEIRNELDDKAAYDLLPRNETEGTTHTKAADTMKAGPPGLPFAGALDTMGGPAPKKTPKKTPAKTPAKTPVKAGR